MNRKEGGSSLYFLVGILLLFSGAMGQNSTFYVIAGVFLIMGLMKRKK